MSRPAQWTYGDATFTAVQNLKNFPKEGLERVGLLFRDSATGEFAGVAKLSSNFMETDTEMPKMLQQVVVAFNQHASFIGSEAAQPLAITLMGSAQIINIGLSGVSLTLLLRRLERLSQEIAHLEEVVKSEFNRERTMRFTSALQTARDVYEGQDVDWRSNAARTAIDGLFEARQQFFYDFEKLKVSGESSTEELVKAQYLLIHAMYAETSRIRCYLEAGQRDLALQRLNEDLPKIRGMVNEMINAWLGATPVEYFHSSITPQDLDRFLRLQYWLRGKEVSRAQSLFELLNEYRTEFWNRNVLNRVEVGGVGRLVGQFAGNKGKSGIELMGEALEKAEIMKENFLRLEGYDLEIRADRLMQDIDRSETEDQDASDEEQDVTVYLNEKYLQRVNRLKS